MTEGYGKAAADPDGVADLAQELRLIRVQAGRSLKELERITASSDSSLSR
ncbi:hypothetical protein [Peterkaempfera griseoplana]|nr:hypothetical protein [Peterkaempfera griseoplana]